MRIGLILTEALVGLRRNISMVISVVLVTFVSLTFVGAAILVPTAEFRAVGGFDERFFMNAEEVDLQRRLRGRGVPSVYCGTVHVVHEGGGSSGDGARRRAWLVEGRTRYAQKWGGRRRQRAALTAASVVNLGWGAARAAAGRPTTPLRTFRREMTWIHRPGR